MRRISVLVDCEEDECGKCRFKEMCNNSYYVCGVYNVSLYMEGYWNDSLKIFRCAECKDKEIKE